ncbi:MAG TPA: hypothetical protein VEH57_03545 [Thermoplasmata archaeon]|nr:hypothetical protein [Thermoplasmata archaeon]
MAESHPVRISRGGPPRAVRGTATRAESELPPPEQRVNRGGTQRALRTGFVFLFAMVMVYAILAAYDRSAPGGASSSAFVGFEWFTLFAGLIAVGGFLFALSPAPRWVELRSDSIVVKGRFGSSRRFPLDATYATSLIRRLPAGWLSSEPLEVVEVRSQGVRRTYLVETGLIPLGDGASLG